MKGKKLSKTDKYNNIGRTCTYVRGGKSFTGIIEEVALDEDGFYSYWVRLTNTAWDEVELSEMRTIH